MEYYAEEPILFEDAATYLQLRFNMYMYIR